MENYLVYIIDDQPIVTGPGIHLLPALRVAVDAAIAKGIVGVEVTEYAKQTEKLG